MGRLYGPQPEENRDRSGHGTEAPDREWPELSNSPIEPDSGASNRKPVLRWILFIAFVFLMVLTAYHEPILERLGGYLVVSHELEDSDLIVCLSGRVIERGLAAADVYREGFAPNVFIAPEVPPDGYEALARHGIEVPVSIDIIRRILMKMEVPESAVIEGGIPAGSTMAEAMMIKALAREKGYTSFIVVTSPPHARRAWWAFRNVLDEEDVVVRMHPTSYSGFRAEDWWKKRRYVREVILEYQKLAYYALKYYL
ncbi:MAG: YdcF family protein [Thermodesulfobacteriota bacterium]